MWKDPATIDGYEFVKIGEKTKETVSAGIKSWTNYDNNNCTMWLQPLPTTTEEPSTSTPWNNRNKDYFNNHNDVQSQLHHNDSRAQQLEESSLLRWVNSR